MAAPIGNEFWKRRSKHGRDKIVSDAKVMQEAMYEYFSKISQNTIKKPELIKSGELAGKQIDLEIKDYPTKPELATFLGFSSWDALTNYKDYSDDFLEVISEAENIIFSWKIKGAAAGVYNPSIVSRDLGLQDNTNNNIKIIEQPLFPE